MCQGVSVVLCCHNSASRLPETFACLSRQIVPAGLRWEVLLVDNGSTDGTADAAKRLWSRQTEVPLRVVKESRLGLAHARLCGFSNAAFDLVSFVDDDNRVCPSWVEQVSVTFARDRRIGACGGLNEPVFETAPPSWFDRYQRSFAVGPQSDSPGDISGKEGFLFGAGLSVRKEAWTELWSAGFRFALMGRQGNRVLCGEDYELCLALRAAGWKIWYEPSLRLQHFLPKGRLDWRYLRSMMRNAGYVDPLLEAYFRATGGQGDDAQLSWRAYALQRLRCLLKQPRVLLRACFAEGRGDADVLALERTFGNLQGIIGLRSEYGRFAGRIRQAAWNRLSQPSRSMTNGDR